MIVPIALLSVGAIFIIAGFRNQSISDVINGVAPPADPSSDSSNSDSTSNPAGVPVGGGLQLPESFTPTHQTDGLPGYPAIDVMGRPGTQVLSPVAGVVTRLSGMPPTVGAWKGAGGPFGWSIYVKGNNGHTYFMTHFGSRSVHVGTHVNKGQVIGTVGDYPGSTPDHIHIGKN